MTTSSSRVGRLGIKSAILLAAIGMGCASTAHATFFSTDMQGTYNTGSVVTTSNTFDLSGNGSGIVTISADGTDDISVSVAAGYLDASPMDGLLFVQPSTSMPGPVDSLMDGASGPFYIYASAADANGATSRSFPWIDSYHAASPIL